MRHIRNLKEEHELKLQDVALAKTRKLDKIKEELEVGIQNFEQELLRLAADNAALSRIVDKSTKGAAAVDHVEPEKVVEVSNSLALTLKYISLIFY
ncbi:hypothetical protein TSUD_419950, partial [Trifolium subterraneum]